METGKNNTDTKRCFGRITLKENNHLVISDSLDFFSYSFIDLKAGQCVGLCSFPLKGIGYEKTDEQIKIIKSKSEISNHYKRTSILFSNRECTLIPEEIYNKQDKKKYIDLLFSDQYSGIYNAMHLPALGNYLIYKIPATKDKMYREYFPGALFYHSTGYLLNTLNRLSFKHNKHLVHTHFLKNHFEVAIFLKGKLLFYNSFEFQTSEEIAYYILYAIKQWNVEVDKIVISGQLTPDSDELYWLKKYIKQIEIFPIDELLPYPASIDNPQLYINLLNLELCE